ncbi:MAG: LamG-like jellyroll fold domain-containing protein [Verrucomicrobiota bacterium]
MNPDENERLIDDLLEGDISEAEFLKLEAELIVSPEAREAYYDRLKLHTGLQEEARSDGVALPRATPASTGNDQRRIDPILLTAIGALILLVSLLFFKVVEDAPAAIAEPVASGFGVIAEISDAEWKPGSELSRGDLIPALPVSLQKGRAKIELFNGTELVIEGPAHFTLISETEIQFSHGHIQALIPEVARALQISTPHGTLVKGGPEFTIEVQKEDIVIDVIEASAEWTAKSGERETILAGSALHWNSSGTAEKKLSTAVPMAVVEAGFSREQASRFDEWTTYRAEILNDPALLAYYAIAKDPSGNFSLQDLTNRQTVGAIVLADQTPDRWNRSRSALDFSPMGSRVRVTVPGEHRSLTLMCWVKIDSLDRLYNSLFLTDGHELHEPHWQIMNDGRLFFSVRASTGGKGKDKHIAYSPRIWSPAQSGQWMHLTTVYDGEAFTISHYLNGKAISIDQIPEPLHPDKAIIGAASIGNWSEPRYRKDAEFAVRNLNGSIDEFGIWTRPLGSEEVRSIWINSHP